MIKISQLQTRDVADLHLKGVDGEPLYFRDVATGEEKPVLIKLFGPGSEPYRRAQAAAHRRVTALLKKGRNALEARTPDERAAETATLLADITQGVEGLDLEAASVREGVLALYGNPHCGWIAEQVNTFAADWANFSVSAPKA